MSSPHPYVTPTLTVLYLPDAITGGVPAILIKPPTEKHPAAFRLTPQVYAAVYQGVDQLADRWAADADGWTDKRRAAVEKAVEVLRDLWEWLVARAPNGVIATEELQPARFPSVTGVIREVELAGRAVPLEEYNPTAPLPEWFAPAASKAVGVDDPPGVAAAQTRQNKKKKSPSRARLAAGDAIATGGRSAGMFDGL